MLKAVSGLQLLVTIGEQHSLRSDQSVKMFASFLNITRKNGLLSFLKCTPVDLITNICSVATVVTVQAVRVRCGQQEIFTAKINTGNAKCGCTVSWSRSHKCSSHSLEFPVSFYQLQLSEIPSYASLERAWKKIINLSKISIVHSHSLQRDPNKVVKTLKSRSDSSNTMDVHPLLVQNHWLF